MYRVKLKDIRCYDNLLGKILKIGLPTGVQNIVISLSNVIVQSSVNSFGAVAMAGFAAYIKVDGFNILPVLSFSMAATTFVGQNVGAGRLDRVKKGMYVSVAMGIIYTVCTGILLLTFYPVHILTSYKKQYNKNTGQQLTDICRNSCAYDSHFQYDDKQKIKKNIRCSRNHQIDK